MVVVRTDIEGNVLDYDVVEQSTRSNALKRRSKSRRAKSNEQPITSSQTSQNEQSPRINRARQIEQSPRESQTSALIWYSCG